VSHPLALDAAGPAPLLLDLVAGFSGEQLKAALEYCRDWNTNSRTCHVAQSVLQAILIRHAPQVRPRSNPLLHKHSMSSGSAA
jgi:hypothetical protein